MTEDVGRSKLELSPAGAGYRAAGGPLPVSGDRPEAAWVDISEGGAA